MPSERAPAAVAVLIVAAVFGSSWQTASATSLRTASRVNLSSALGFIRETYTTNALCSKNNCINPVFPGMEDLHRLQQAQWIASSLTTVSSSMNFCRSALTYDPALPVPEGHGSSSVEYLVKRQDDAASTMFFQHVSALGLEAWEYQKPEHANDCVKSVWRMLCYTYFPRAEVGVQDGALSTYSRPCQSSCMNYVRACNVECCDESVKCVFTHHKPLPSGQLVQTEGYIPHDGPSSMCTGAARRAATPLGSGAAFWAFAALLFSLDGAMISGGMRSLLAGMGGRRVLLITTLVVLALSLQGCDYDVPVHRVGNWRSQADYLVQSEFIAPGSSANDAQLNSCAVARLSQSLQCSGRGVCKTWNKNGSDNTLSFCKCDANWAGPECRIPRKSQAVAYLLSMFLGMFGADMFYLGFPIYGVVKLFSLGGFGFWWVADIIRIGSAPVRTSTFRTSADLPHAAFVLTCVAFAIFLGFLLSYIVTIIYRRNKRMEALLLTSDEASVQNAVKPEFADAYKSSKGKPVKPVINGQPTNYGAMPMGGMRMGTMPMGSMPMGSMPMGSMRMP